MKNKTIIYSVFFIVSLFFFSCTKTQFPQVQTISAMKKVMMGEDLSAHIQWDSIAKENLYAVAPLGRIQGEVTIIDGKMYATKVEANNQISLQNNWDIQSPFTVCAYVAQWNEYEEKTTIASEEELQKLVEKIAKKNGYDLNKPFVFRIIAKFDSINYHIISKPLNEVEHNHQLHKKAKKQFELKNIQGELLGFYSQNHEGVFTHKGQFIHTHFLDKEQKNAGHLDHVQTKQTIKILLPKIK